MAEHRRLLVIGCRGRLGQALMRVLDGQYEMLGVGHHDLDITDRPRVLACLETVRPNVVLHAAAMTRVDACERDSASAFHVNAEGARSIAEACTHVGARLVYYSTDYVFDGRQKRPYVESDPPNPINAYGRSKLAGEQMVQNHCPDAAIMRVAWLYGLEGGSFVKTIIHHGRSQIAARARGQAVDRLRVVADQIGTPTLTEDIARQTALVIERQMTGIVHAVAHGEASWFDWATAVLSNLSVEAELEACGAEAYWQVAKRPAYSALTNSRLAEEGIDVMRPWRDALADFCQQHREELVKW